MSYSFFEPLEARQLLSVNVAINTADRHQTIDGFGTSVAWYVPNLYDTPAWQNAYYQDLGSSMLRVDLNIDALPGSDGDFATPVTMVDDLQTNINAFDWNSVPTQRFGAVASAANSKKLDSFKLVGSIWTPPQWMKGAEVNPSTGAPTTTMPQLVENDKWGYPIFDSAGGSLIDTPDNLQQFGRYVAAYVKGFEQHFGVPMYAVSIANEPAFHEAYNSAVYSPALYVDALKAVADAFHHYGITTKIMGPEDVGVGSTSNQSVLNRQLKYINAINADPIAKADLAQYTIHGYADDGVTDNRSAAMWANYWNDIKASGKKSWMSEDSGQSPNWSGALSLAANAQDALVQGNVSAWLYWQMSDGTTADGYALTGGADTTAPKYTAAKHFFRYIRPGSVRVGATPSDPNGVYVSAYVNDSAKTLTSVLLNLSSTAQTVNLSIGGLNVSSFSIARESTASQVWTNIGPVKVTGDIATLTLPAGSILTLQGATTPVTLPPQPPTGASISGTVWNDSDGDSIKDSTESGMSNIKLFLDTNKNGILDTGEKTTTTDSHGNYAFTNLAAGTYRVREIKPSKFRIDTPGAGYFDLTLASSRQLTAKNFGNTQKVLITGTVFNDINNDKTKNSTEPGLSGWKIFIDTDGDGVWDSNERYTLTDSSGNFAFKTLGAGTYKLRIVQQSGWTRTTPTSGYYTLNLTAGATAAGKLFGEKK